MGHLARPATRVISHRGRGDRLRHLRPTGRGDLLRPGEERRARATGLRGCRLHGRPGDQDDSTASTGRPARAQRSGPGRVYVPRRDPVGVAALRATVPAGVSNRAGHPAGGAAAQEGRLKQELSRRYRYVHLATHGFFASPQQINALRLKVRPPASGTAAALRPGQMPGAEDLAWLESGVVLTGAGRAPQPGQTGQEDGILTAEEVAALDLRGTELVTLSACDTALGQIGAVRGCWACSRRSRRPVRGRW